jgi:tetratricopeptide (TPR) repeat protein
MLQKDYKTAINFYSTAIKYAPFPTLITRKAYCEAMLDRDNQAISDLKLAASIQPSLFEPLYSLMMMYVKLKDLENARERANLIINKEIKVPSEKIVYYKEQARIVIRSMK